MNIDCIKSNTIYGLVDCDCFFASCEILRHPNLKGKKVCVGGDIIVAATYEAKAKGIKTGTPIWEAKKILGREGYFFKPDLGFYGQVSSRLMNFLENYANHVEVFSIDEAFVDITGVNELYKKSYAEFIEFLKQEIYKNIGIPVSIGASNTKLLAKTFAKLKKPFGSFCAIKNEEINDTLKNIKVGDIPFIGKMSEIKIKNYSPTAFDFKHLDISIIKSILKGNGLKIWFEINSINAFEINKNENPKGISRTRSFNPNFTNDKSWLMSHLIYNFERAFEELIDLGMGFKKLTILLRRKDFKIDYGEHSFNEFINNRTIILNILKKLYNEIFKNGILYRSTGVIFNNLEKNTYKQLDLFNFNKRSTKLSETVNKINQKFGRFMIQSASSIKYKARIRIDGFIGEVQ